MHKLKILNKSIPEIQNLIEKGKVIYPDIIDEIEFMINYCESKVNAFITIDLEKARLKAKEIGGKTKNTNILTGIPISVKDTFTTNNVRTTAASKMLEDFVPDYDATAYKRLKNQGAILIGKTNMDEFAHGFTTEYSSFGPTHNPWNHSLVPGGSSGGSAASVASRTSVLSLASENYGSIIQPASLCGVVGMKPTYGRSSRFGIIAMASSLECPGIIGKCVEDVAIGTTYIIGKDPLDNTSVFFEKEDFYNNLTKEIKGKKIAVIKTISNIIDKKIQKHIEETRQIFNNLGVKFDYIDWYNPNDDIYIYDILYRAEVASNLARYDGLRYGYRPPGSFSSLDKYYPEARNKFGKHVKRQILTDPITLSAKEGKNVYKEALKLRRFHKEYIDQVFQQYDAILTPTAAFISLEIGKIDDQKWRDNNRKLGEINGAIMCPTVLYGYPSITFPVSITENRLPIGIQLYTKQFHEQVLFNLAFSFQEKTGLKCLVPKFDNF